MFSSFGIIVNPQVGVNASVSLPGQPFDYGVGISASFGPARQSATEAVIQAVISLASMGVIDSNQVATVAHNAASYAWQNVAGTIQGFAESEAEIMNNARAGVGNYLDQVGDNVGRFGDNYRNMVDALMAGIGAAGKNAGEGLGLTTTILIAGGILAAIVALKR